MPGFRHVMTGLCVAGLLGACSSAGTPPPAKQAAAPKIYELGEARFDLTGAELLQTWPIVEYRTPLRYARLAVQVSPSSLVGGLPDDAGSIVQIDILAPRDTTQADRVLAQNFTDWSGRELRVAGTRYHYDPGSPLLKDGGRAVYVRHAAVVSGLESLTPPDPRGRAPEFFLRRDGAKVDTAIDCREDVPPSAGTGEYCSLTRQIGTAYGYRILFRRDLLPHWAALDTAARDYLAQAAARGG